MTFSTRLPSTATAKVLEYSIALSDNIDHLRSYSTSCHAKKNKKYPQTLTLTFSGKSGFQGKCPF